MKASTSAPTTPESADAAEDAALRILRGAGQSGRVAAAQAGATRIHRGSRDRGGRALSSPPGTSMTLRWPRRWPRGTAVPGHGVHGSPQTSRLEGRRGRPDHRGARRPERHRGGSRTRSCATTLAACRFAGPRDQRARMRVAGALQRRGFSSALVIRVMRGLISARTFERTRLADSVVMEYTHLGRSGLSVSRLCLGTMNFGPLTDEPTSHRDHGFGARCRPQLLRHRQRLRMEEGRGHHRADRRQMVRAGWRTPREGRARHQALRLDERLAQRHVPLRPQHPQRVRGLAATPADRPHRPLPDASRRPEHAVRRDLGGDGSAGAAGQDPLRRLVELRRLDHRAGAGDWREPGTSSGSSASSACTTSSSATSRRRSIPRRSTTESASSPGARSCAGCSAASSPRSRGPAGRRRR